MPLAASPNTGGAAEQQLVSPQFGKPESLASAQRVTEVAGAVQGSASAGAYLGEFESVETGDAPTDAPPADGPKPPARYRPRLRERSKGTAPAPRVSTQQARDSGALDADLSIFFQPGGWGITVSVLLRRGAGVPEEVVVRIGEDTVSVMAIDDGFFEPVPLLGIGNALREGVAVETIDAPRRRWIRTKRTLHVFSERAGISGFASVARSVIGQENVLLCADEIGTDVLNFCQATGAEALVEVAGPGVAAGWRCFRGYRPKRPAQQDGADEILLALNPLPDAAIDLSGGISIGRGIWIPDRPPVIRLIGIDPMDGELTIDGQTAVPATGGWNSLNWDVPGRHVVRYGGLSRSYEIVAPEDNWEFWNAHPGEHFCACGAAVTSTSGIRSVVLPTAGCWLLGAQPGQAAWAAPSAYGSAIASPAFEPVWAILPRIGKTRQAPRLLASTVPPLEPAPQAASVAVLHWRQLVRNAAPRLEAPEADGLWQQYRRAAQALKRRRRR